MDPNSSSLHRRVECFKKFIFYIILEKHFFLYFSISRATVFLGTTDLSQTQPGQQRFEVNNANDIITHPNYRRQGLFNDIALIRLPRDIQYTERIQPVKLAINSAATYVNQEALASGYGRIRDDMRTNQLWWTSLRVMTNMQCMNYYGSIITNEKLCTHTGPPPHSTCQGDSGGPLVLTNNRMLIGVSSFVGSSCEGNAPAGFQRVNVHKRWIERTTGQTF